MGWTWDTFDTYRLHKDDLEGYLTQQFGYYDFFIEPRGDQYRFWIPEKLTAVMSLSRRRLLSLT
ncbi:hypothetical protein BKA66DRAFT_449540 [Pyrenochaeta sp. MPI-SDFR-AT-0127]|nr:hypothetical protein BKA66DRAFT_449540 [Pyrenochaeta sp. MPI-SDFR-AT-0127]